MSFDAFQGCNSLFDVYVEDGCDINIRSRIPYNTSVMSVRETMVGDEILWRLRMLKNVRLAEGLERLGSYWFCGSQIESINISASVREIGIETFCGCERLRDVFIDVEESRLKRICYKAFSNSAITAFCCPKQL